MRFLLIASLAESLLNFRGSLISALQESGLTVHVAAPDLPVGSLLRIQLESRGLIVHSIPMLRTGTNPIEDLRTFWALLRLMRNIRPHFVMSYTIKPVIYGSLSAWFARVPKRFALITGLGYAFQEDEQRGRLRKIVERLYALSLGRVHKVFFQNPDDEALFRVRGILVDHTSSCVVNGSGVDIDHFSLAPLPPEGVRFLLIARLLGDKGVREYAEAARRVRARHPDAQFAIAGWIDSNPNAIEKHELDTWVNDGTLEYLGRLSDVRPAIAASSVYVLPSYREGTPRTVLEAMAMGRAVITTNAPGCRETVVDGSNGFLVIVKSVHDLERAMLKFIEEPTLVKLMGLNSRQLAEEKYDVHKVNEFMLSEMEIR